ncbi:MAG: HAMP domain-containing protein, partial [Actinomycetota bacterium]|nr:HAMP domain-containing protein [Actinomycetota bacterium]
DTLGIDFVGFVSESRAQLDEALAALSASSGAVRLPSGVTIGEEIASIESELADVRAEFDAQAQRPDSVNAVFDRLVSFVDDISEQTRQVLQEAATTSELAGIGAESEQFLSTLQSATTNLRLVADASIAGGERSLVLEAMVATGAFEESLDRLRSLLDGQRLTEFDELVASPAFAAVDEALPTLVEALTLVDDSGINVIDDTSTLTAIIDVLIASFDRLTALQSYGNSFLEEQVQRAGAIRAQADADRRDAIRVMVAVLGISLVLLGLILLSILRPLRRLVRHSRQVGEGDLALAPVKPTGPTDIRVVMRTFNEMVTTLRAYDAQVRRLALGDTEIDRTLPGPLGDTLRQSVSHLAAVTSKLHASEAAANEQARTDSLTGL